jgi:CRISPR-associated protein Csy1
MTSESSDETGRQQVRAVIETFIADRLAAKLDGLKEGDDEKREKLREEYEPENWLASAAKRVSQIRLVTHAVKYSHPDARGTSVHAPKELIPEPLIGTSGPGLVDDVVGNAAALDVFKFLRLEVSGASLLQRAQAEDAELLAALSPDSAQAQSWCKAFAGITESAETTSSDTLAKQLYFPLQEGGYHLLAPLYPSSLAHLIHQRIQHTRFSGEAKSAREARRNQAVHAGYCEYPDVATRAFGGSKPQNISQLNSERGGVGYLLPSLPPQWTAQGIRPPAAVTTIFSGWLQRHSTELRRLVREMKQYLEGLPSDRERSTVDMRERRAAYVDAIVDEVLFVTAQVQVLPAGWSAEPGCQLDPAECCWLDPLRAESDEGFAALCRRGTWMEEVAHRFANWLNGLLYSEKLPMADAEHHEWRGVFFDVLRYDTELPE